MLKNTMKIWNEEEFEKCVKLLINGKTYEEISLILNRSKKSVRLKLNKAGLKYKDYKISKYEIILCLNCGNEFDSLISEKRKFCSSKCSAIYNNKKRSNNKNCLNCGINIITKNKYKNIYCSNNCQQEYHWKEKKSKIENGDISYSNRIYKKYLIEIHGEKCMECNWNKKNPITGNVPIELEHIDGNSDNKSLDNLKLLCPNCHSLTPTYKALNVGNGRYKRRERYKNGKSY